MTITGGNILLNPNKILQKLNIEEGMKVADLGCGSSGHFVFPMSKMIGKNGIAYAVDILKPTLAHIEEMAKSEYIKNIKIIWSDLEIFNATKIESNTLDVALLVNTLFQTTKRTEVVRESIRMLKKNGKLLVVDWKITAAPFGPPKEKKINKQALKKISIRLGLNLISEFSAGQYHFGLIFKKQ